MTIYQGELDCLDYDSTLDTSRHYNFEPAVIDEALRGTISTLADSARERIKHIVSRQGYLPREVKERILKNL